MKIETNHIIYVARLPLHFWNEMRKIEDFRDNIGLSLISWVVARSLNHEYTELPEQLRPYFAEAEEFSENIDEITDWFSKQLKSLISATSENHPLSGKLSTLAYNFFAGMGVNVLLGNKRDLLITSKVEFDALQAEILKSPDRAPLPPASA